MLLECEAFFIFFDVAAYALSKNRLSTNVNKLRSSVFSSTSLSSDSLNSSTITKLSSNVTLRFLLISKVSDSILVSNSTDLCTSLFMVCISS